jgi:phage tail-like protein
MAPINGQPKKFMSPKKYRVTIQGIGVIDTSKCSGLEVSVEKLMHHEGGNVNPAALLPGNREDKPIVIERGRTLDHRVVDWALLCMSGRARFEDMAREVTIEQLDLNDDVLLGYTAHKAIVTGWKESDRDNKATEVVIETLTLEHMGLDFTRR